MALCISCNVTTENDDQACFILEMGFELFFMLPERITKQEIKEDTVLCKQCFQGLTTRLAANVSQQPVYSAHDINLCFTCRASLLRKRSVTLHGGPERNEIARTSRAQLPLNARVCYACWFRVKRHLSRQPQEDAAQNREREDDLDGAGPLRPPLIITESCILCEGSLIGRRTHTLPEGLERSHIATIIQPRQIPDNARVCHACWAAVQRSAHKEREIEEIQPPSVQAASRNSTGNEGQTAVSDQSKNQTVVSDHSTSQTVVSDHSKNQTAMIGHSKNQTPTSSDHSKNQTAVSGHSNNQTVVSIRCKNQPVVNIIVEKQTIVDDSQKSAAVDIHTGAGDDCHDISEDDCEAVFDNDFAFYHNVSKLSDDKEDMEVEPQNLGNASLAYLSHKVLKHRSICEDHFEVKDVLKHVARSRLVPTAVPLMHEPVTPPYKNEDKDEDKNEDKNEDIYDENKCNFCSGEIKEYRYTCVQCPDYDLCGSCEARGAHCLHYVLRIPRPKPYAETQLLLREIRRLLSGADTDVLWTQPNELKKEKEEELNDELDPLDIDCVMQTSSEAEDNVPEISTLSSKTKSHGKRQENNDTVPEVNKQPLLKSHLHKATTYTRHKETLTDDTRSAASTSILYTASTRLAPDGNTLLTIETSPQAMYTRTPASKSSLFTASTSVSSDGNTVLTIATNVEDTDSTSRPVPTTSRLYASSSITAAGTETISNKIKITGDSHLQVPMATKRKGSENVEASKPKIVFVKGPKKLIIMPAMPKIISPGNKLKIVKKSSATGQPKAPGTVSAVRLGNQSRQDAPR